MESRTPLKVIRTSAIAFVVSLCLLHPASSQQKTQFTQYMFNGIIINPAYAGANEALSLTAVQRSQWTGIKNGPVTQAFSAHSLFKQKKLGLGLTVVNDKLGVHSNQSVMTQYAFHLAVSQHSTLSFGLQGGINNFKSNYASLRSAANDPLVNDPILSRTFFDLGTGLYYRSRRFHAGLSAPEIIPQRVSFNDTLAVQLSKVNMFIFTKYRFTASNFIDLEPSVLLKHLRGIPTSFDVNLSMIYRKVLVTGLSYRKNESVDFLLKMQINSQLQLGYSYDHPIGGLRPITNGSHELWVNYVFRDIKQKVVSPRR
jgi:type IX secretion system PorP/SprF family membrane protein